MGGLPIELTLRVHQPRLQSPVLLGHQSKTFWVFNTTLFDLQSQSLEGYCWHKYVETSSNHKPYMARAYFGLLK